MKTITRLMLDAQFALENYKPKAVRPKLVVNYIAQDPSGTWYSFEYTPVWVREMWDDSTDSEMGLWVERQLFTNVPAKDCEQEVYRLIG